MNEILGVFLFKKNSTIHTYIYIYLYVIPHLKDLFNVLYFGSSAVTDDKWQLISLKQPDCFCTFTPLYSCRKCSQKILNPVTYEVFL